MSKKLYVTVTDSTYERLTSYVSAISPHNVSCTKSLVVEKFLSICLNTFHPFGAVTKDVLSSPLPDSFVIPRSIFSLSNDVVKK